MLGAVLSCPVVPTVSSICILLTLFMFVCFAIRTLEKRRPSLELSQDTVGPKAQEQKNEWGT